MNVVTSRAVAAVCVAAGLCAPASAQPGMVDSAVFRNVSAADANDFHITFTKGRLQDSRAANMHSNRILGQNGARRGQFNTITTTNAQGGGVGAQTRVDFTAPRNVADNMDIVVPNKHVMSATLGFTRREFLEFSATFTLNGAPIANSAQRVDPNKKFRPIGRGIGLGEFVFEVEALAAFDASLTNARAWTGLSMDDLSAIDLLDEGDATLLDDLLLGAGERGTLSLGEHSADSFAVVKFECSFYDHELGEWIDVGTLVHGGVVPAPGAPLLLVGAGMLGARRRR